MLEKNIFNEDEFSDAESRELRDFSSMSGVHSSPRARKKLFKHHLQSVRSLALLEQ